MLPLGITLPAVFGEIEGSPSMFGLRVATIYGPDDQTAVTDVPEHETLLASVDDAGQPGNSYSTDLPSMAAHGSAVGFTSFATHLVPDDTNGVEDVFVRTICEK